MNTIVLFLKLLKTSIKYGIKLNIGSASINYDKKWIPSDIHTLNILNVDDWKKNLLIFKATNIMAEHVWEHLFEHEIRIANVNCYNFLKKGGKLRLAVPDGYFPNEEYIGYVKPGGFGAGSDDHKILFNYKTLKIYLEEIGFRVNLLEYWDEEGKFHYNEWNVSDGFIERSSKFDERNQNGKLKYTSLIVDAIKE